MRTVFHHLTKEELIEKVLANYIAQTTVRCQKLKLTKKKQEALVSIAYERSTAILEIDCQCINTIYSSLLADTNQLFELPEAQRVALFKVAGELSRPNRDEFQRRRKDAKKAAKRKMIAKDIHARKSTGIRSAREAALFVAPKLLQQQVF